MTFRGYWNFTGSMTTERGNRLYCKDKVHIQYIEYHSVCPSVGIGTPHSLSLQRVCTKEPKGGGGGHTCLRVRLWGVPIPVTREKAYHSVYSVVIRNRFRGIYAEVLTSLKIWALCTTYTTEYGCYIPLYIRGYVRIKNKKTGSIKVFLS
jgi:hypothetical protein